MRKNSVKSTRVNAEVLRELAHIISREIKDPRIDPMTSVTSVEVAPDLKTCKAYISVLGSDEALQQTLEGLRSAEGYIRRQLAHSVNLRNTPEIIFLPDHSIEYSIYMAQRIEEVIREDESRAVTEPADAEDETGDGSDGDDET